MAIHVILEFETREEAIKELGSLEARHIVEWFDDQDLRADYQETAKTALESQVMELQSA